MQEIKHQSNKVKVIKCKERELQMQENILASNWELRLPILAIDQKHMMIMKS